MRCGDAVWLLLFLYTEEKGKNGCGVVWGYDSVFEKKAGVNRKRGHRSIAESGETLPFLFDLKKIRFISDFCMSYPAGTGFEN